MKKIPDSEIIGKRFGRLIPSKEAYSHPKRSFLCKCDCGIQKEVILDYLRNGYTKSCGCLQQESRTKHGLHESKIYGVWRAMKARCMNKKNKAYNNYGGRHEKNKIEIIEEIDI